MSEQWEQKFEEIKHNLLVLECSNKFGQEDRKKFLRLSSELMSVAGDVSIKISDASYHRLDQIQSMNKPSP